MEELKNFTAGLVDGCKHCSSSLSSNPYDPTHNMERGGTVKPAGGFVQEEEFGSS